MKKRDHALGMTYSRIKVKVISCSPFNRIMGFYNGELVVKIKAVPEKGKANSELVRFLCRELDIKKADAAIRQGANSHHKALIIPTFAHEILLKRFPVEP